MHTNYQLDGNTNTEKDRAGLRLLPVSEVLVREVKVDHQRLRARVRPDDRHGLQRDHAVGHQRPARVGELPLQAQPACRRGRSSSRPTARKPDTEANDVTATLGGPIKKDKWHFFGAYEYVDRSLITGNQVITVTPADAQALGITLPADGVIPAHQKVNFGFGKTDYQVSPATSSSVRYFCFKNLSPSNIGGGLDDDRSRDRLHGPDGLGVGAAGVHDRRRAC